LVVDVSDFEEREELTVEHVPELLLIQHIATLLLVVEDSSKVSEFLNLPLNSVLVTFIFFYFVTEFVVDELVQVQLQLENLAPVLKPPALLLSLLTSSASEDKGELGHPKIFGK
jgi:hypothetical protein